MHGPHLWSTIAKRDELVETRSLLCSPSHGQQAGLPPCVDEHGLTIDGEDEKEEEEEFVSPKGGLAIGLQGQWRLLQATCGQCS